MTQTQLLRRNPKATLALGFLLVVVLLTANSLVSYRNFRRVLDNDALVTRSREVLLELQGALSSMQDAEAGQRGFIITGDENYLQPYDAGLASVDGHLARLRALIKAPSVRRYVPTLERQVAVRVESLRENVEVRRTGGFEIARKHILSGVGKRRMDELRGTIARMQAEETTLLRQREAESTASGRTALRALGVSALMTLGLLFIVMLVLRRDAAHRERAAINAKKSEERLAAIVASTSQIVWTRSPRGDFVVEQPTWSAFTGLPFATLEGRGWMDAIHPDDRARVAAGWDRAVADPGPYQVEYRLRRGDGAYRDMAVSAVPVREADGSAREWVGTSTDVTGRKAAEAALETHARLANLSGEVGVALTQDAPLQGILQACAEALVRDLGASVARVWTLDGSGEALELQASAGLDTDVEGSQSRLPVAEHPIGRIARDATPTVVRLEPHDPGFGEAEWIERSGAVGFAGYPLLLDGRALGVVGVYSPEPPLARDALKALAAVADAIALGVNRKRVERDLERAKEGAEEASRTKSLFLANMSHELRTPLNAILGYSEMLQEEAEDQGVPDFVPDLQKINSAGRHLLSLINDVLDISKIEAGKMELYLEEFDVAALLDEVEATVAPLVEKNGNTLVVERRGQLGTMRGDLTKVRQCLFNLVSNAAKFTSGGTIGLEVGRERMESVDSGSPEDWMTFRVTDTGIGMSAEGILKLFQAFTQADASTTRKYGGTGLGLTITRRFCQMMGGDVTVSSVPGEGSAFTMKIRASVEEPSATETSEASEEEGAPKASPPAPGTCVLVIDDDPVQRDLMRRFLEREGFPAETADGGEEGLRLARRLRPLAITLDVMMPGMDGWSALAALKADPDLRDTPVVMLTMVDDQRRGYAMGAADYATKPVDRAHLARILQRHACPEPPCTILLVEDDEPTRDVMGAMLRKDGWTVREAANGVKALESIQERLPHLILLDLMMPEMDGFEFAETLRANEAWRAVPIVVLTAMDLGEEDRRRLDGRVQSVVQKSGQSIEDVLRQVRDLVVASTTEGAKPAD